MREHTRTPRAGGYARALQSSRGIATWEASLLRILKIAAVSVIALAIVAAVAWRWVRGPDPAIILASIEVEASPVLDADEALARFRVAPGYRVELVAHEPLVVDPVAMDWDDEGRLYVVEMRGFMGDLAGGGEDRPIGRVVVLEDDDGDGRMDRSRVYAEDLVLPRAIAVLPEGVLIGEPPRLFLCVDGDRDGRCRKNERRTLTRYAADPGNVEHQENGLLPALDGWIYNAKSRRRFRLRGDTFEETPTVFRGQWGIAQDDEGRLFYNHNSGFAYVDAFPAEYVRRQPETETADVRPGVNVPLAEGELVWGIRVAPGLNRAYLAGTLRADGRQAGPTAVSGLVVQRGDQYGVEFEGDVFVPESGGAAVARFEIEWNGLTPTSRHVLYEDPDWERREFLASTDERFRPVDVKVGPDGAIWVIDMYRGVIQHAHYVSEHLRKYALERGLEDPGATGRIWRIVREDRPITYVPPPMASPADRLEALDHPNGWVRDRAQRALVAMKALTPSTAAALADLARWTPNGRLHALEVLAQTGTLEVETLRAATRNADASTRRAALRLAAEHAPPDAVLEWAFVALDDPDAATRLQAIHALGEVPIALRPIDRLLGLARRADGVERQAALSGLGGVEHAALLRALEAGSAQDEDLIRSLALAAMLAAQRGEDAAARTGQFLDAVAAIEDPKRASLVAEGAAAARTRPGARRIELAGPHPLFEAEVDPVLAEALASLRSSVTWPGDARPGGARALTAEENARRARGEALFAASCATCHGQQGRGNEGLAPPLVGSSWVRDSDDWLVRIALHGVQGPIRVAGETWNLAMPGHVRDPRFDDDTLAGLLTHLRRSWGHGDEPVAPATVERIRRETADRLVPWTEAELLSLDVVHRLDRYAGRYAVPLVGLELEVVREDAALTIGRPDGPRAPMSELGDGLFSSEGMRIQFEPDETGDVPSARVHYEGQSFPVSRVTE